MTVDEFVKLVKSNKLIIINYVYLLYKYFLIFVFFAGGYAAPYVPFG